MFCNLLKKIKFYLKPSFPDFKLHVVFLTFTHVHAVKVFFADLLQPIWNKDGITLKPVLTAGRFYCLKVPVIQDYCVPPVS